MVVREDIPLAPLTTFRMGPIARYVIDIESPDDIPEAAAFIRDHALPFFILGGGSNVILTDSSRYEGVVLRMRIMGFELVEPTLLRIGAGEVWDEVVERSVREGLTGIEALSAIPGSAGATPIQNVGAYGREIADVLEHVEAYDLETASFVRLAREDCAFSYRDSRFKQESRFVITAITLRLSHEGPIVPEYPGVAAYLEERGIIDPSAEHIRNTIIAIRKTKLPDPRRVASVGSFFKNPIIDQGVAERIKSEYESPILFALPDGRYKAGAGWLIDTLGLKGEAFGRIGVYPENALVLTNLGGATSEELKAAIHAIQEQVRSRYGITLEPEPVFIGSALSSSISVAQ